MKTLHIEYENKSTSEIIERTMEVDDEEYSDICADPMGALNTPNDLRELGFVVVNAY